MSTSEIVAIAQDPVVIAGALALLIVVFLYRHFVVMAGEDVPSEKDSAPSEDAEPIYETSWKLPLPSDMPYREYFRDDGVKTEEEIRNLDSLTEVWGIGPSRSSDVYRWFKETDDVAQLPDHLMPEIDQRGGGFRRRSF